MKKICGMFRLLKGNFHKYHECHVNVNDHMANILFKSVLSEETIQMLLQHVQRRTQRLNLYEQSEMLT